MSSRANSAFVRQRKEKGINDADCSCEYQKEHFDVYIGRAGLGKMATLATRFVWGAESAGRMLSRGSENTSPREFKRTLNSSGGYWRYRQEAGMLLQAQAVPRKCNSGLAEQNGTKGGGLMIEVYIDGSSKGNPGPGGAGIVIQDSYTRVLGTHGIPLGHVTNNQAEFLALKHALTGIKTRGLSEQPIRFLPIRSSSSAFSPRTGRPERTWSW